MSLPPRIRAIAPFLVVPVAVAFGIIAPGSAQQRFLDVLVALALCAAAGGAMALVDGLAGKRPTRDIIVAVMLITFGLAVAFSMLDELATQFAPAMWLVVLLVGVVLVGVRLISISPRPSSKSLSKSSSRPQYKPKSDSGDESVRDWTQ